MFRALVRQSILMVASLASSAALMALLVAAGLVGMGHTGPADPSHRAFDPVVTQLAPQLQSTATAVPVQAACRAEAAGSC